MSTCCCFITTFFLFHTFVMFLLSGVFFALEVLSAFFPFSFVYFLFSWLMLSIFISFFFLKGICCVALCVKFVFSFFL